MLVTLLVGTALASCPVDTAPAGEVGVETWCEAADGTREGPSTVWEREQAWVGSYVADAREGTWLAYDRESRVRAVARYRKGSPVGTWRTFHASGSVAVVARFRRGQGHGTWTWYREDGSLAQLGTYDEGREEED